MNNTFSDTKNRYGISAMPTFLVLINGQKMDMIRGANREALEACVKKWCENIPTQHPCPIPNQMDLSVFLDRAGIECLNEDDRNNIRSLLDGASSLRSDCDEQLIVS
jgi:thioredoxin-like negative regulator of GroEL